MKHLKNALLLIALLVFQFTFFGSAVYAAANPVSQGACSPDALGSSGAGSSPVCTATDQNTVTGSNGLISTVADIVAWITGVAAVFMIIFSGFRFITAGGDSGKVSSARNGILYSSIGLLVVVLARIIVSFVINNVK